MRPRAQQSVCGLLERISSSQVGPLKERIHITTSDVAGQKRARLSIWFGREKWLQKISANDGVGPVWPIAERMQSAQKFLHDKRRKEQIDGDDRWAVFVDSAEVPFVTSSTIELGMGATQLLGLHLFHLVDFAAQKTRSPRLEVVYRSGNVRNSAGAVRV